MLVVPPGARTKPRPSFPTTRPKSHPLALIPNPNYADENPPVALVILLVVLAIRVTMPCCYYYLALTRTQSNSLWPDHLQQHGVFA